MTFNLNIAIVSLFYIEDPGQSSSFLSTLSIKHRILRCYKWFIDDFCHNHDRATNDYQIVGVR